MQTLLILVLGIAALGDTYPTQDPNYDLNTVKRIRRYIYGEDRTDKTAENNEHNIVISNEQITREDSTLDGEGVTNEKADCTNKHRHHGHHKGHTRNRVTQIDGQNYGNETHKCTNRNRHVGEGQSNEYYNSQINHNHERHGYRRHNCSNYDEFQNQNIHEGDTTTQSEDSNEHKWRDHQYHTNNRHHHRGHTREDCGHRRNEHEREEKDKQDGESSAQSDSNEHKLQEEKMHTHRGHHHNKHGKGGCEHGHIQDSTDTDSKLHSGDNSDDHVIRTTEIADRSSMGQNFNYDQGRDLYRQAMTNFQGNLGQGVNQNSEHRGGYQEHGY